MARAWRGQAPAMEGRTGQSFSSSWTADLRATDMSLQTTAAVKLNQRTQGSTTSLPSIGSPKKQAAVEEVRQKFRHTLVSRYRSVVGAWRELDPRQHGRLSFFDFCRACHRLGYERDTRQLWEAMDRNRDGFVSLDEVDANVARLLQGFAEVMEERCGSAEAAWQRFFTAKGGYGRCTPEVFRRACEEIGYLGNVEAVYNALNVEMSTTGVSFKEFLLLDRWFRAVEETGGRGKWHYETLRPMSTFPARARSTTLSPPRMLLRS